MAGEILHRLTRESKITFPLMLSPLTFSQGSHIDLRSFISRLNHISRNVPQLKTKFRARWRLSSGPFRTFGSDGKCCPLSTPRTLLHSHLRLYSAGAHTSGTFSPQRNTIQTQTLRAPPAGLHTAEQKPYRSESSDTGGHTGVNSPASGSKKKLISLDLKRESPWASLVQRHPTTNSDWESQQGPQWKRLPLRAGHSRLPQLC